MTRNIWKRSQSIYLLHILFFTEDLWLPGGSLLNLKAIQIREERKLVTKIPLHLLFNLFYSFRKMNLGEQSWPISLESTRRWMISSPEKFRMKICLKTVIKRNWMCLIKQSKFSVLCIRRRHLILISLHFLFLCFDFSSCC